MQVVEKEIHCLQNLVPLRNQISHFVQLKGAGPVKALDLIISVPCHPLQKVQLRYIYVYIYILLLLIHLSNIHFYYMLFIIEFIYLCKIWPGTGESSSIQEPLEQSQEDGLSRFFFCYSKP